MGVPFLRFFPPYNVGEALINVSATYLVKEVFGSNADYFDWEVAGRNIAYLTYESFIYLGLVLISELSILRRLRRLRCNSRKRTRFVYFSIKKARNQEPFFFF